MEEVPFIGFSTAIPRGRRVPTAGSRDGAAAPTDEVATRHGVVARAEARALSDQVVRAISEEACRIGIGQAIPPGLGGQASSSAPFPPPATT